MKWAISLERRLLASKGKGGGKGRWADVSEEASKTWDQMTSDERWYIEELWNGNLRRRVQEADERHGGAVQAQPFCIATSMDF